MENTDAVDNINKQKLKEQLEKASAEFVTLDSGKRQEFSTGAVRDTNSGKGRYDLIPPEAMRRLAGLYERGAVKYGDSNWRKGMSVKRVMESLMRHAYDYLEGKVTEDVICAVAWNAFAVMTYEELVKKGKLPPDLLDLDWQVEQREQLKKTNVTTVTTKPNIDIAKKLEELAREGQDEYNKPRTGGFKS